MTNLFTDTFTASNESLATYGNGWVVDTGTAASWTIVSNALQYANTAGVTSSIHNPANIGATTDYKVYASFSTDPTSAVHGIYGRYTNSSNWYLACGNPASGTLQIFKSVGGSITSLGSASVATSTCWLSMQGTAIKASHDGGTTIDISVSDSSLSSGGNAGIRDDGAGAPQVLYDNFTVDDFNSGSTPISGSDSATLTDTANQIGLGGPSDSSSVAETNAIGLGNTDSGAVAEGANSIGLNGADAVAEAEQILGIKLGASDSGATTESTSTSAQVSASDTGTLTDSASASQNGGTTPSGSEGTTTSESASIGASISASDLAALAEQAAIALGASDPATLAEQIKLGLAAADSAALLEQLQIAVAAAATDSSALAELQTAVTAALAAAEAAHVGESATVQIFAGGVRDWVYVIGAPSAKWLVTSPIAKWSIFTPQQ